MKNWRKKLWKLMEKVMIFVMITENLFPNKIIIFPYWKNHFFIYFKKKKKKKEFLGKRTKWKKRLIIQKAPESLTPESPWNQKPWNPLNPRKGVTIMIVNFFLKRKKCRYFFFLVHSQRLLHQLKVVESAAMDTTPRGGNNGLQVLF